MSTLELDLKSSWWNIMEPLLRLTLLAKTNKICFKQFGRVFLQAALRKNRMLMALAMRLFCESHLNETVGAVKMQQIQRFSSLSFHSLNSFPFPQSVHTESSVPFKKSVAGLCIPQASGQAVGAQEVFRSQSVHRKIWFARSGPDLTRQVAKSGIERRGLWRNVDSCRSCRIYFSRPTWSLYYLYNTEHITALAVISQSTGLWRLDQRIPLALNNFVMSYPLLDVTMLTSMAPE